MYRRLFVATCMFLSAAVSTACGGWEGPDPTGQSTQSISGSVTFTACTNARQQKLQRAMGVLFADLFINGDATLECLKDANTVMDNDRSPESILWRLQLSNITQITCSPTVCSSATANACASVGLASNIERLSMRSSFIDANTPRRIASIIAHEVAHNRGFSHPSVSDAEYNFTILEQVEACVRWGSPNGETRKSSEPLRSTLAHVGGPGGSYQSVHCDHNAFARGLRFAQGDYIQGIEMRCDPVAGNYVGTPSSTRPRFGSFSGATATRTQLCQADELVVGIRGNAGDRLDRVGTICAPIARIRNRQDFDADSAGLRRFARFGEAGGSSFNRLCPVGTALNQLDGNAGSTISKVHLVCQNIDTLLFWPTNLAKIGNYSGATERIRCNGNSALTSLYGRRGATIDAIGGVCRQIYDGTMSLMSHASERVGGSGGTTFTDNCPVGQVLVGVRARYDNNVVRGIQGICASRRQWLQSNVPAPTVYTPWRGGGSGGALTTRSCARQNLLVGFDAWKGSDGSGHTVVKGLRPICQSFSSL